MLKSKTYKTISLKNYRKIGSRWYGTVAWKKTERAAKTVLRLNPGGKIMKLKYGYAIYSPFNIKNPKDAPRKSEIEFENWVIK